MATGGADVADAAPVANEDIFFGALLSRAPRGARAAAVTVTVTVLSALWVCVCCVGALAWLRPLYEAAGPATARCEGSRASGMLEAMGRRALDCDSGPWRRKFSSITYRSLFAKNRF